MLHSVAQQAVTWSRQLRQESAFSLGLTLCNVYAEVMAMYLMLENGGEKNDSGGVQQNATEPRIEPPLSY
jgi:hypothetical protein